MDLVRTDNYLPIVVYVSMPSTPKSQSQRLDFCLFLGHFLYFFLIKMKPKDGFVDSDDL